MPADTRPQDEAADGSDAQLEDQDPAAVAAGLRRPPTAAFLDCWICYSLSFQCPALYLRALDAHGAPLAWARLLSVLPPEYRSIAESPGAALEFLMPAEHPQDPALSPGCFCVHPCRTREVLALLLSSDLPAPSDSPADRSRAALLSRLAALPPTFRDDRAVAYLFAWLSIYGPIAGLL